MSAYSTGATTFVRAQARATTNEVAEKAGLDAEGKKNLEQALAPERDDALAIIVKWVPGEVIGSYGAFIAGMLAVADGDASKRDGSEFSVLVVFLAIAFLLSLLGAYLAFRKSKPTGKMPKLERIEMFSRAALAATGLALWSFVIPGSYLNQSDLYTDWKGGAPTLIFLLAVLFGLFAEFIVLPTSLRGVRAWSARRR